MKKIILFLFLIAGVFVSAEAQTRPSHPPRTFNQERHRHRPHNRIRHLDRRQKAELRRIHRRHKVRRQMRSTAMQYEHIKLYKENTTKAA